MLSYETSEAGATEVQDVGPSFPFLTEQQRAIRAIVVGLALAAALAALAHRS